jgi:hypothetical protein
MNFIAKNGRFHLEKLFVQFMQITEDATSLSTYYELKFDCEVYSISHI